MLALASSEASVRAAIAGSGHADMFFPLLSSADHVVRCHAGLALSKLSAIGQVQHTPEQQEDLTKAVCCRQLLIVLTLLCSDDGSAACLEIGTRQKKTCKLPFVRDLADSSSQQDTPSSKNASIFDTISASAVEDSGVAAEQSVRHSVESLAYLTLNVPVKKLLASHAVCLGRCCY